MLNIKKVEPELISDADIYLSFGKCMREGVSYIHRRYSNGNNISNLMIQNKNQNILYT